MVVFLLWSQSIFRRQREGFALYLRLLLNTNIIELFVWSFSSSWILSSLLRLLICSKANDTLFSIYICKPIIDSSQSCSGMKTRHLRGRSLTHADQWTLLSQFSEACITLVLLFKARAGSVWLFIVWRKYRVIFLQQTLRTLDEVFTCRVFAETVFRFNSHTTACIKLNLLVNVCLNMTCSFCET